LFIDQIERKVQLLEVRAGGFLGLGDRHFLLPVSAITSVTKGEVHVNQTREHIVGSPVYDPALIVAPTREYWGQYYGYYGMSPYWGSGFMYPYYPISREYPDTNEPCGPSERLRATANGGFIAIVAPPALDELCINTLRFLAVDMVQKAKSGHPGLPLGSASMAYALWDRSLKFNPRDPHWPEPGSVRALGRARMRAVVRVASRHGL
jgi:hypothetical protein